MIDVWINNGCGWNVEPIKSQYMCGWNVEPIKSQYMNISTCRLLSESSYMDLPVELRSPRKGLINIKNKDEKCFFMVSC